MTSKLVYKKGFGPFAPEVYRAPGPYPYRGVTSMRRSRRSRTSSVGRRPGVGRVRRARAGAGRGRLHPHAAGLPRPASGAARAHGILYVDDEVQSGVGRTGPVWAIEHYGVEPDLVVSGKSLGGGLPLAGVTGRAEVMDAPHPGGLGGTFGGNPLRARLRRCPDEVASLGSAAGRCARRGCGAGSEEIAERVATVGEVRGLGPMLAIELVTDPETKAPAADLAKPTMDLA